MANHPNRSTTDRDLRTISNIAKRAARLAAHHGDNVKALEIAACLLWAHERCPLDLERLEQAGDGNFAHDVFGIRRHINLDGGDELFRDCFWPRYARPTSR